MKRIALVCLAAGMLAAGAPGAAQATPPVQQYMTADTGVCAFWAANDTTPGGVLGGIDVWNGVVWARHLSTAAVRCYLWVNGVSQGLILGPSLVAAAALLTFTAASTDIVTICDHVNGIPHCSDATIS